MRTTGKIRPSRASGAGGIVVGLMALFVIAPFFFFIGSNIPLPFGSLIGLFPVVIGIYAIVTGCMTIFGQAPFGEDIEVNDSLSGNLSQVRGTEDRLDELERLKRRDMITPEEYAAKRQEILKDL